MYRSSFRQFFVGTAAVLVLSVSLCPTSNAQTRRRGHRRPPAQQQFTVALTQQGYQPAALTLRRGVPAKITFVRRVAATCGTQIVLPDYGIKRDLPLDVPVVVEFTPAKAGTFSFACGMGMLKGSIIVR